MADLVWRPKRTASGDRPYGFLGEIVVKWVFDIAAEQAEEFHDWLRDHEAAMASALAALDRGIRYRGTYGVLDPSAGYERIPRYRTYWAFDTQDALEAWDPERQSLPDALRWHLNEFAGFWLRDPKRWEEVYVPACQGAAYKLGADYSYMPRFQSETSGSPGGIATADLVWEVPPEEAAAPDHQFASIFAKWVFDIPADEIRGFHDWLQKNENPMAASLDAVGRGVSYLGTYGIQRTNDAGYPHIQRYRTYWGFLSRATLEAWDPTSRELPADLRRYLGEHAFQWLRDRQRLEEIYIPAADGVAYKPGGRYVYFSG